MPNLNNLSLFVAFTVAELCTLVYILRGVRTAWQRVALPGIGAPERWGAGAAAAFSCTLLPWPLWSCCAVRGACGLGAGGIPLVCVSMPSSRLLEAAATLAWSSPVVGTCSTPSPTLGQ